MIPFFLFLSAGLAIFAAGFVLGTAYGVQQEAKETHKRLEILRDLRRRGILTKDDY